MNTIQVDLYEILEQCLLARVEWNFLPEVGDCFSYDDKHFVVESRRWKIVGGDFHNPRLEIMLRGI